MDSLRKNIVLGVYCGGNTFIIDMSKIQHKTGWIRSKNPSGNEVMSGMPLSPEAPFSGITKFYANATLHSGSDHDGDVVFETDANTTTECDGDYDGDTYHEQMGG